VSSRLRVRLLFSENVMRWSIDGLSARFHPPKNWRIAPMRLPEHLIFVVANGGGSGWAL
jgi:hypothetical protein